MTSHCSRRVGTHVVLLTGAVLVVLISGQTRAAENADADWQMYNGTYTAQRYSAAKQITRENVGSLAEVGRFTLPETTSFQSGPVIVGNTLFVTTATSTYAVSATTAKPLWTHKYEPKSLGLGTGIRGLAYSAGRLYRGTPDAHLIALDAKSGKLIWDVVAFDTTKGEYIAAAPLVWEGRIYLGNAGSDVGAIGHIRAFDAKDGRVLWNFDVVPSTGAGAESWPNAPDKVRAGGGMYSSYALDTADGSLYAPTGNPGPDFAGHYRPGDNLYTSSVVRLDARTGALRSYHQFEKNDVHDWDIAASPILFTSRRGHKMVAVGAKNGYLYGLDRGLSKVAYQVPVTTIDNVDAPLTVQGTRFCPGTQGGVNWFGPAYSPQQNAIYVNAIDWCTVIKLAEPGKLEHAYGMPFLGSSNAFGDSDANKRSGWLTAIDADTGKMLWKYHASLPLVAGLTPTAGGRGVHRRSGGQPARLRCRVRQAAAEEPHRRPDRWRHQHVCDRGQAIRGGGRRHEERDHEDRFGARCDRHLRAGFALVRTSQHHPTPALIAHRGRWTPYEPPRQS